MSRQVAVRQDMPPAKGYAPIHWKRYAPKRTIPGYFLASVYLGGSIYCIYKTMLTRFEATVNKSHYYWMQSRMTPFLMAEEDRRMVRARKQHESDLKLLVGDEWDVHRRTMLREDLFVPYSSRELRVLLTDDERVSLGGEPSRYSRNDLFTNYYWQQDDFEDQSREISNQRMRDLDCFMPELD
eukprot:sb/3471508/